MVKAQETIGIEGQNIKRVTSRVDSSSIVDLRDAVLQADAESIARLLASGILGPDTPVDKQGQTALMEAARNGHVGVLKVLLSHGANSTRKCKNGHTAIEIAQFYKQKDSFDLLKSTMPDNQTSHSEPFFTSTLNLDRDGQFRENPEKLKKRLNSNTSRFLLIHKLLPVTRSCLKDHSLEVAWVTGRELCNLLSITSPTDLASSAILLGIYSPRDSTSSLPIEKDSALFAIDISHLDKRKLGESLGNDVEVAPGVIDMLTLVHEEAAFCAQAITLINWHQKNAFCSICGNTTSTSNAGYKLICSNTKCITHKGAHNVSHPRVDPSIAVAVIHPENEACILVRGHDFPPRMYSCVAGFVEPGENISTACRREVQEEVGVMLDKLTYLVSQPWPLPTSTLMVGCIAHSTATKLKVDENELEDARWFERAEVVDMITQSHKDQLIVSPPQTLGHLLIKTWLQQTAFSL